VDIIQTLGAAITFGSALGATIAGFFAYRQKSLVTVLRESNNDYKERVEQLEEDRDSKKREVESLTTRIMFLEREKQLPLEELTKLIMQQHTQQLQLMGKMAESIKRKRNE